MGSSDIDENKHYVKALNNFLSFFPAFGSVPEAVELPRSRLLPLLPPGGVVHPGHAHTLGLVDLPQRYDHQEVAGQSVEFHPEYVGFLI